MSEIKIPENLKPSDPRFGCGPSKIRPAALQVLAGPGAKILGTSHRQKEVKSVVSRVRSGLSSLFDLPQGYEVVLGNGGSTAFWDIATFGLIEKKSQHLSFGEFSSKFAQAAKEAPFLDEPSVIKSEPGTHPQAVVEAGVDAYCLTHNETSTGVAMQIKRPAKSDGALVLVDATSAAGGLSVTASEFVNVLYHQENGQYYGKIVNYSLIDRTFIGFVCHFYKDQIYIYVPELKIDELKKFSKMISSDVYKHLTLEGSIKSRNHIGGTSYDQVKKAIEKAKKSLNK